MPCWRQQETLAFPLEEFHAEMVFELADARRDIGLDAAQPLGRSRYAAFSDDSREYAQIRQFHPSPLKNETIIIIHFLKGLASPMKEMRPNGTDGLMKPRAVPVRNGEQDDDQA